MARDTALSPAAVAPSLVLAHVAERPLPPPAILATLLLVGGEVMLFAGLIFAFWVLRLAAPVWPPIQTGMAGRCTGFGRT